MELRLRCANSLENWKANVMEQWENLIQKAQEGDKSSRDKLIADNLGLVHTIVRRFEHRGHEREELFQIGCIGLMKAIDYFDLSLKLAFSTYAVPMIMGEIRRYLRDDGMVKVSRTLKEQGYKISKAKELLSSELGREPSLLEISALTELSVDEILMAQEANREVESIYQPVYGSDGDELLLIDQISDKNQNGYMEEPEKEAVLNEIVIKQLLETLSEQERRLIELRYFEGKTQCEVATVLETSQVQVSRMERRILHKMREMLA